MLLAKRTLGSALDLAGKQSHQLVGLLFTSALSKRVISSSLAAGPHRWGQLYSSSEAPQPSQPHCHQWSSRLQLCLFGLNGFPHSL